MGRDLAEARLEPFPRKILAPLWIDRPLRVTTRSLPPTPTPHYIRPMRPLALAGLVLLVLGGFVLVLLLAGSRRRG